MLTMDFRKRPKPKLDRRNAVKNINYDASWSPSSSSSTTTSLHGRRTPSRDYLDSKTSFRIEGLHDGEFDLLCRILGFSSPEDFAIPVAVWEAQKARAHSRCDDCTVSSPPADAEPAGPVTACSGADVIELREEKCSDISVMEADSGVVGVCVGPSGVDGDRCGEYGGFGVGFRDGGGINGERPPPVLAPPPGRFRRQVVVDDVSSTWDILRSLAPQDDDEMERDCGCRILREEEQRRDVNGGDAEVVPKSSVSAGGGGGGDGVGAIVEREYCMSPDPDGKLRRIISSWQKGELLGSGSFGTVYEGFTDDGFFFAVKEVSLLDQGIQGKQCILQLEQEISLLRQFKHRNIVQYLGTEKDESKLYIFLELATKGSLAKLYQKYRLRDSQVSAYTRQILNGLKYLHDRNVVHRDIKCANILVDATGSVKLADFGLAKATKLNDVKSSKGSPFWMAPEVVNLKNHGYGLAADIWSLGCTVLEMLTGQPPYSHLEGMQALFRIGKGEAPPVPDSLSTDARDFVLKCLQVNPSNRPTAVQLLGHPFLQRPVPTLWSPSSPHFNSF
ncbi:hypothetical protein Tsubulata_022573 [Turnera subulata]|uniref:mitogen-activated protein kinase kinase kinase n=1 Tax=Turnera subulata TaxID=218843 RepID=A0A9Q0FZA8_9ROSI|nr:hypothetical protein Tsubulata_022573 [Turnera subulata]